MAAQMVAPMDTYRINGFLPRLPLQASADAFSAYLQGMMQSSGRGLLADLNCQARSMVYHSYCPLPVSFIHNRHHNRVAPAVPTLSHYEILHRSLHKTLL